MAVGPTVFVCALFQRLRRRHSNVPWALAREDTSARGLAKTCRESCSLMYSTDGTPSPSVNEYLLLTVQKQIEDMVLDTATSPHATSEWAEEVVKVRIHEEPKSPGYLRAGK